MLKFNVPAGIGDIAWLYGKLKNMDRPFGFRICGEQPRRSLPFVDLLPGVENLGYGDFGYHQAFVKDKLGLPADTDPRQLPDGEYYLSCNIHVDSGNRIEQFLPSLPMTFHWNPNFEEGDLEWAANELNQPKNVLVYTSKCNALSKEWAFWDQFQWAEFLSMIYDHLGGCSFYVVGADFDGELGPALCQVLNKKGYEASNMAGKTSVSKVLSLIRMCSYFIAYPSGLGIMGDVLKTPTMMFLPTPRHDKLKDIYANPDSIASGRHINHLFSSPEEAFQVWKEKGAKFL